MKQILKFLFSTSLLTTLFLTFSSPVHADTVTCSSLGTISVSGAPTGVIANGDLSEINLTITGLNPDVAYGIDVEDGLGATIASGNADVTFTGNVGKAKLTGGAISSDSIDLMVRRYINIYRKSDSTNLCQVSTYQIQVTPNYTCTVRAQNGCSETSGELGWFRLEGHCEDQSGNPLTGSVNFRPEDLWNTDSDVNADGWFAAKWEDVEPGSYHVLIESDNVFHNPDIWQGRVSVPENCNEEAEIINQTSGEGLTVSQIRPQTCAGSGTTPNDTVLETALGCIPTNPKGFIIWLFQTSFGLAGGIAFLVMAFGAFTFMTSQGNPEKITAGKDLIVSAITGLLFIIFAVLLLRIIGVEILKIPGFT